MFILAPRVLKLLAVALCVPTLALSQAVQPPVRIAMIEGLSGPLGNTGEAVFRNLVWAVERVNARGGVKLAATPGAPVSQRALSLERYDSKGQTEEALSALKSAIDDGAQVIMQGNNSSTAAALIDAINKHNEREPGKRVLFLNYSAVDPSLTNEKCSFWHFRFDAHADMRMSALMDVLKDDKSLHGVYIIGQDYSFGQAVLRDGTSFEYAVGAGADSNAALPPIPDLGAPKVDQSTLDNGKVTELMTAAAERHAEHDLAFAYHTNELAATSLAVARSRQMFRCAQQDA